MTTQHIRAVNVCDITDEDALTELELAMDSLRAGFNPDDLADYHPLEYAANILAAANCYPNPDNNGIGAFVSTLTHEIQVSAVFATDFDGEPRIEDGLLLMAYLDSPTNAVTAHTDSLGEILHRGGYNTKDLTQEITAQHVLDGIAGLLSDAVACTLSRFIAGGIAADPKVMLTLAEALGDADSLREELSYAQDLDQRESQALTELSDDELNRALDQIITSPLGARTQEQINFAMESKAMEIIIGSMSGEFANLQRLALNIAAGRKTPDTPQK